MRIEKITPNDLEALIADEEYVVQGTMTICTLTLHSGFKVVGSAACLNAEDFNTTIGADISRQRAFDQLWALEAYHRRAVAAGEKR